MPENSDYPKPDTQLEAIATEVIGAAIAVHIVLGPGHKESVYENALCHELELRGIPYERQKTIEVGYKGKNVGEGRLDLLVRGRLVVELKAVEVLNDVFGLQLKWYLKVMNEPLGLLLNFQVPAMNNKNAIRRVVVGRV
jgi:GxxExxY protein